MTIADANAGASIRWNRDWRWWLGTLGGAILGVVFLIAAWAKALDPAAFAEQIRYEGLDVLLSAPAVALTALVLEAALGTALLLGVRRLWVLVPAAVLVGFFLVLTGRTWWLAEHGVAPPPGCGCFGNLVQRTPAEAFLQDLLLLVPPLALAFVGRARGGPRFPPARTLVIVAAGLAAGLLGWKAPELPLDDLATRLSPGVRLAEICSGGDDALCLDTVLPDIARGEHFVVLADLDAPDIDALVPKLTEHADSIGAPPLAVVSAAPPESHTAFFWRSGLRSHQAPEGLLRPLYRTLPRAFLVRDGRVVETYSGLPSPQLVTASSDPSGGPPA